MYATHDSLTSYRLKTWFYKPCNFIARCQNRTIESQYNVGVRYFDFRFTKYKGNYYAAHGLMVYDITLEETLRKLSELTERFKSIVYFRIVLENTFYKNVTGDEFKIDVLNELQKYSDVYMKIHWIGEKANWGNHSFYLDIPNYGKNDYTTDAEGFATKVQELESIEHPNTLSLYECFTYKGIPKLFGLPYPKYAAKHVNPHIFGNTNVVKDLNLVMIDFV